MKSSKRIACLLLTLLVSGYLAVRFEVQLHHSLEEASYHSRLSAAANAATYDERQPGVRSGLQLQDLHACHSCLICNPRVTVAFEPAKDWKARLVTGNSLVALQRHSFPSRHIDCPHRRAPPAALLS